MERPVITALADVLRRHVDLSKSRLETMALLTVGMSGARPDLSYPGIWCMWRMNGGRTGGIRPRPIAGCSGSFSMCGVPQTGPRR